MTSNPNQPSGQDLASSVDFGDFNSLEAFDDLANLDFSILNTTQVSGPIHLDSDMGTGTYQQHDATLNDFSYSGYGVPQVLQPMPQPAPTTLPALSTVPSYHPMIGWYYPAAAPAGYPTPVNTEAQTSTAAYVPQALEQPSTVSTFTNGKNAEAGPNANYRGPEKTKNAARKPRRFAKRGSIVKYCVCTKEATRKIPRPKNAFILYRSHHTKEILDQAGTTNYQNVSKIAGESWSRESPEVKNKFYALAEDEKRTHAAMYPGYQYNPGAYQAARFGDERCSCGAYEVNMQALRNKEAFHAGKISGVESAQRVPTTYEPTADLAHSLSRGNTAGSSSLLQKRRRSTEVVVEEEHASKRPRRGVSKVVSYAEDRDDDPHFELPSQATDHMQHQPAAPTPSSLFPDVFDDWGLSPDEWSNYLPGLDATIDFQGQSQHIPQSDTNLPHSEESSSEGSTASTATRRSGRIAKQRQASAASLQK